MSYSTHLMDAFVEAAQIVDETGRDDGTESSVNAIEGSFADFSDFGAINDESNFQSHQANVICRLEPMKSM